MKKLKLVSALTAVLLIVIVILQNTQSVTTKFLFFTISMPNAVLIGLTLLIGIASGILVALTLSGKRDNTK
jgi:lipopolysaccharide assembly protein A